MKQVIRKGLKEIIVDDVPAPALVPHHLIVQTVYSLISSGTETASIHREGILRAVSNNRSQLRKVWEIMKAQGPRRTLAEVKARFNEYAVLGYSGAGMVVDKHRTVSGIEIGDRVAYGGEGTGHSEYTLVGRNLAARIPPTVPYEHACFATLGSIALHAVRIAEVGIGDRVAIVGLGLVGQLTAQLVRIQGGIPIGIDVKPERLELARRLGAEKVLLADGETRESVETLTNGLGVDSVVVAAASRSTKPGHQALEMLRDRGRMVIVGNVTLSFPWHEMYRKEIQLFMARAYGAGSYDPAYEKLGQDYPISYVRWTEQRNMEEFLRLVARGLVQLQPLITHEIPLEEAPKAYQTIMDPSAKSLAVVLRYPTSAPSHSSTLVEPRRKVELRSPCEVQGKLRVGLIGVGSHARWVHLPNLKKIPCAYLQAVHSSSGARGKNLALRFGAQYCCSDYEEILQDPEIDVVVITSYNQHHSSQALAALRAGKHVFLEKPMALTEEECRSLWHAVGETGKQLTVGFNRRFAPSYVQLKQQIAHRTGPAVLNCRINSPGISSSYWMADPRIGGAILGEACHFVDLMYWLLEEEPISVSAYCLPTGKQEPIGENNLVASFLFADGSVGNLTYCTIGSKTSAGERMEFLAPGMRAVSEDFRRLMIYTGVRRTQRWWFPEKGHAAQLQSFFERIQACQSPEVTARDGARATIACLRMLESAKTLARCSIDLEAVLR